ncbi:hypothetical protein AURDEDRAFT_166023 [Auricularia subglabra TFB-10046 SS5]|nr:hypothetical protein AURDEDRAFT_166023 [Auricularia subglabra TFB-10046 SS5]
MDDEPQAAWQSTPVPVPDDAPVHPAWDPKDPEPAERPSEPIMPSVPHMQILMKFVSMKRRMNVDGAAVDINALNAQLANAGSSTRIRSRPEAPILASNEWDEWAAEAFDAAVTGTFHARPMPLPFLFRSHDQLFDRLANYRKKCEGWLNVVRAVRNQLGIADPQLEAQRHSRPRLPEFIPNTVPSFSGDPTAPTLLRPDAANVLREHGDVDATAPLLTRGSQFRSYAFIPQQTTEDFGPWMSQVLFVSNLGYIPLPPRNRLAVRRIDGRFGAHEESRYAQWHEFGRYHMVFIPTCADGDVNKLVHSDPTRDMAWYDLDIDAHCIDTGEGRYLVSRDVQAAMARDWSQAQKDYVCWGQLRGVQLGIPQHAFLRGRQCLGHLAHPQNQRQLLETVAGYQRYLQEVRGRNNYQQCCSEQRDVDR